MKTRPSFSLYFLSIMMGTLMHAQIPAYNWVKKFQSPTGTTSNAIGMDIVVDSKGNVYNCGTFNSVVDFDPGPSTSTAAALPGGTSVYLTKMDSMGNLIWVRAFAGHKYIERLTISLDVLEDIVVAGAFSGAIALDYTAPNSTIAAVGDFDLFINKFESDGDWVWGKTIGGPGTELTGDMCTDPTGNIILTGSFTDSLDFDPGSAVQKRKSLGGSKDAFLLKLSNSGNFVWAQTYGAPFTLAEVESKDVICDAVGNMYVTGYFQQLVDFDYGPGLAQLSASCKIGAFLLKLSPSGAYQWVHSFGGLSGTEGIAVALDKLGNPILVGNMGIVSKTGDFDPGPGIFNLQSNGGYDIFIVKLDALGNFLSGGSMGGVAGDSPKDVAVDRFNNIHIMGFFYGSADFDPSPSKSFILNTPTSPNRDFFSVLLNASCNFIWAGNLKSLSHCIPGAVCAENAGGVYYTGYIIYQDFDMGPGTVSLQGNFPPAFILKTKLQCSAPANPVNNTPLSGLTICYGLNAKLTATGSGTVSWYTSQTAITALSTGTVYITPVLGTGPHTIYAEAYTCAGSASRTAFTFTINACTIIPDEEKQSQMIEIFPQPISEYGKIVLEKPIQRATLKIMDMNGRCVREVNELSGSQFTFQREDLTAGLYFIRIEDQGVVVGSKRILLVD